MEEVKQMATREGFKEVFWKRHIRSKSLNPTTSWRQTFEAMEDEYIREYGRPLWASFDAFRVWMNRHR